MYWRQETRVSFASADMVLVSMSTHSPMTLCELEVVNPVSPPHKVQLARTDLGIALEAPGEWMKWLPSKMIPLP